MKALVTGGGGFLGRAIVEQLVARGDQVRSLQRGDYPELAKLGVELVRADLQDRSAVLRATDGIDAVFHVAAKPGIWGTRDEFYGPNVRGTENVLTACLTTGVPKLIHTSSPSVVFSGKDIEGADESLPYPDHFEALYPETKAIAERAVLAANDSKLATVALRPHLIWGPRDNHLVPRIIARAKAGKLRRIGDGRNKVDTVYVDNAAKAHLLACDKLAPGSACAGKAYFITNGDPRPLWEIVTAILAAAGLPPETRSVPLGVARVVGAGMEAAYSLLGLRGEPRMTRFLAGELATAHWFDISAARRDLGYEPEVSIDEGMRRLAEWLKTAPALV